MTPVRPLIRKTSQKISFETTSSFFWSSPEAFPAPPARPVMPEMPAF
jgi:hypothetical protein